MFAARRADRVVAEFAPTALLAAYITGQRGRPRHRLLPAAAGASAALAAALARTRSGAAALCGARRCSAARAAASCLVTHAARGAIRCGLQYSHCETRAAGRSNPGPPHGVAPLDCFAPLAQPSQ